jgi:hypothetical protein
MSDVKKTVLPVRRKPVIPRRTTCLLTVEPLLQICTIAKLSDPSASGSNSPRMEGDFPFFGAT